MLFCCLILLVKMEQRGDGSHNRGNRKYLVHRLTDMFVFFSKVIQFICMNANVIV